VLQANAARSAQGAYDSLAEAVSKSIDGVTIEIRGNGPFVVRPIQLTSRLIIRAGDGFHPVIRLEDIDGQRTAFFLTARAPLALEGLEFHGDDDSKQADKVAVNSMEAPIHVANCRFVRCELLIQRSPYCWVRNSQFFTGTMPAIVMFGAQRTQIDNNLL